MRWAQPHRDWGGGTCPIATSKVGDTHTHRQDPRETGGWGGGGSQPHRDGAAAQAHSGRGNFARPPP